MRRKILVGFIFCFCLKVSLAAVTVGNCDSDKHPYSTISAAIAAAPVGGVVRVCPGTYAEQLEINKPLTIQGINGIPTIVAPSTGLNDIPAGSYSYPQIFVSNAGGEVKLVHLSVDGSDALFNIEGSAGFLADADAACSDGTISDSNFVGIFFLNTPGVLEGMNISHQFGSILVPGDPGPLEVPNCGSGVVFNGSSRALVRNSTISDVGFYGIFSYGDLIADNNNVSGGFGPYGIGIGASTGTISNNSVTQAIYWIETVGIQGGSLVRDNVVQSAIYGITNSAEVRHNTLTNNAIGISQATAVADNVISGFPTYDNPECINNDACDSFPTGMPLPTIGIDLGCSPADRVRGNNIEGVGIGFANLEAGEKIPRSNLLTNVTTTSTGCSQ